MRPRLKLTLGMAFLLLGTIAGLFIGAQTNVLALNDASLGNMSPWPANSQLGNNPQGNIVHVHYLRKQGLNNGSQPFIELKAYYPKDVTNWNNLSLAFGPGAGMDSHVCDKEADNGTLKNRFIQVYMTAGPNDKTYYIPYDNVCTLQQDRQNQEGLGNGSNNVFYGHYGLPAKPQDVDDDTDMYVVDISIRYDTTVPQGNNGIRFLVRADGGNPDIGPLGSMTGNTSFSILADWDLHDLNNITPTKMVIPFGLACSQTRDIADRAKVRIYDADNGLFVNRVKMRVKNLDTGNYVTFSSSGSDRAGPGQLDMGDTQYTPPNGSGNDVQTAYAVMRNFEAGTHYQLEITGIDTRNTIDVGVPGDPIFGIVNCGWRMKVDTQPTSAIPIHRGDVMRWTHTATNKGGHPTTADINFCARWGKTGKMRANTNFDCTGTKSYTPDQVRTINESFPVPMNAADGDQYCQYAWVNHHSYRDSAAIESDPVCYTVEVDIPPVTTVKYISIVANVPDIADVETQQTATFNGKVTVNGFPTAQVGGWGFTEVAKYGDPVRQPASQQSYASTNTSLGRPAAVKGSCVAWKPNKPHNNANCTSWSWTCNGNGAGTGASAPTCPTRYKHTCQTYSFNNTSPTGTCTDKWVCPAPGNGVHYQQRAPECQVWKCAYGGNAYASANPDVALHCEKRCNAGSGDRPVNYPGDLNCYIQPKFTLVCTWDTGVTMTETVSANGDYCRVPPQPIQKTAGQIGGPMVCATLTPQMPRYPGAWQTNPLPGYGQWPQPNGAYRQIYEYRWTVAADQGCGRVVGKSYLKVYGGDVRVGSALKNLTTQQCVANNTAAIKTLNRGSGDYGGAGVQYAAVANGFIDQFISGQYNALSANPDRGTDPRRLSFASAPGSLGYGGGFANGGQCLDYAATATNPTQNDLTSISINGAVESAVLAARADKKFVHVVHGDVFISSNITYSAQAWSDPSQMMQYQLIVEGGNIFIGNNVTQLDGLYVAIPAANPNTGKIFTCASGINQTPANTWLGCEKQLVVNGAFAAKQVMFYRDCGSLMYSPTDGSPSFTGGIDAQKCSNSVHAAEVFNYVPEQWIRGVSGTPSNRYDYISSMPPVL